jgi:hypothetical protein
MVGAAFYLPRDPTHYYADRYQQLTGCNRLVCTKCGQWLKWWTGYQLAHGPWSLKPEDFVAIYQIQQPEQSAHLQPWADSRVYACHCWADSVSSYFDLYSGNDEFDHWRCGGHA